LISFFAQTEYTPPAALGSWLECAFYVCGVIAAVAVIWKMTRPEPSIEKQLDELRNSFFAALKDHQKHCTDTFATRLELTEKIDHREETAVEFRKEMREDMKGLSDKLSERTSEIFNELRALGREISNVEGRLHRTGRLLQGGDPK